MTWDQLMHAGRLGLAGGRDRDPSGRNEFQRDYDRIVFSAAFRRLQDKTQVFPLARSDYVRTRLTHSLETACVGRSIGFGVGARLLEREPALATVFHPSELGATVSAACLAHDIGNPPFGHAGENAISHWFRESAPGRAVISRLQAEGAPAADFLRFEGNAQGFRILTRLEYPETPGGMRLTHTTLAAFLKYPRAAAVPDAGSGVSAKKHGFFVDDQPQCEAVAAATGLPRRAPGAAAFARHPLAFLVEAADDICYHVVDIEDGFNMGLLEFADAHALYAAVAGAAADSGRITGMGANRHSIVGYLRARCIGTLVQQCVDAFLANADPILAGTFDRELTACMPAAAAFRQLKEVALARVYSAREVVLIEAAGFHVLGKLLDLFVAALDEEAGGRPSQQARTLLKLFPGDPQRRAQARASLYQRVLLATDFVSGLTDRDAVALFKRLTGISLPGE
jgi:dGTPase